GGHEEGDERTQRPEEERDGASRGLRAQPGTDADGDERRVKRGIEQLEPGLADADVAAAGGEVFTHAGVVGALALDDLRAGERPDQPEEDADADQRRPAAPDAPPRGYFPVRHHAVRRSTSAPRKDALAQR